MSIYNQTLHQQEQLEVTEQIETQVLKNQLQFSTVSSVDDYNKDLRRTITSVHLPHRSLIESIQKQILAPLQTIEPSQYYYSPTSLHTTIKNVRVVNQPARFTQADEKKASEVFAKVVPKHQQFSAYYYRLLLFPNNLALIGTTDPELDDLALDLDRELKAADLADDKIYANSQYFFSNISLVRFYTPPSKEFVAKVKEISDHLQFEPYTVDSVTLLTSNAVLEQRTTLGAWNLQSP